MKKLFLLLMSAAYAAAQCTPQVNPLGIIERVICVPSGNASAASVTRTTVSYSATPVFTRTSALQQWTITLTGNVSSSTTSGLTAGDYLTMTVCQDATGGRTFAWPTGFTLATAPDTTASTCTSQTFNWDGTNAQPITSAYCPSCPAKTTYLSPGGGLITILPPNTASNRNITFPDATGTVAIQAATEISAGVFCSDAGSTDAYACNLTTNPTSYVTGTHYRVRANTANTGAATINFNSIGAVTIKKVAGGVTTDLADNDIRAGQWVDVIYDGTNMQMQSTLGNAASGGSTLTLPDCMLSNSCAPVAASSRNAFVTGSVRMIRIRVPGNLTLVKYSVFALNASNSAHAMACAVWTDSSGVPGTKVSGSEFRVVDLAASSMRSGTWGSGAAALTAGIYWLGCATESNALFWGSNGGFGNWTSFQSVFGTGNKPGSVSCSEATTGTGVTYALPATCGTATAQENDNFPLIMANGY